KLPGLNDDLVGRIVAAREAERFTSVLELLKVEGMSEQALLGISTSQAGGSSPRPNPTDSTSPALSRLLTVFSFDPNARGGFGPLASSDVAGRPRIRLQKKGDEAFERAITSRVPADAIEFLLDGPARTGMPTSTSSLVRLLSGLKPEQIAMVLDAVT